MKKIRIIGMVLAAIIMSIGFSSCNPDDKQEETTKKLVKFSYDLIETTFKYDDQGHLIESTEIQMGDIPLNQIYTYVWGDNTIDIRHYIDGIEYEERTLTLENGLAIKLDSASAFFDSTYTYNSSGRIVKCEDIWNTKSIKWNDDKMIEELTVGMGSSSTNTYTYETNATTKGYNPIISNTIMSSHLFTVHPELAGIATQQLFNSVHHHSIFSSSNNEYEYTLNYKYEFDEDGYVNKAIVTYDTEEGEKVNEIFTMVWE